MRERTNKNRKMSCSTVTDWQALSIVLYNIVPETKMKYPKRYKRGKHLHKIYIKNSKIYLKIARWCR